MVNFVSDPNVRPSHLSPLMIDWSSIDFITLSLKSSSLLEQPAFDTIPHATQLGQHSLSVSIIKIYLKQKSTVSSTLLSWMQQPSLSESQRRSLSLFGFFFLSGFSTVFPFICSVPFPRVVWDPYSELFRLIGCLIKYSSFCLLFFLSLLYLSLSSYFAVTHISFVQLFLKEYHSFFLIQVK